MMVGHLLADCLEFSEEVFQFIKIPQKAGVILFTYNTVIERQ